MISENIEISDGAREINLTNLNIRDYEVQITFDGMMIMIQLQKCIFQCFKAKFWFNLNYIQDTINYGESIKLKSFTDNNQATGTVDYYVDGVYNVTANLMEEITLSNFDYGSHVILANYSGDSNSLNDSKNITFTVSDNRNNLNFVVYSGSESNEINYGDNLILTPCFSIWSCWRKFQLLY